VSRVVADLSWELVTSEGVVHVRADRLETRERWGLEDPAGRGPDGCERFDDELPATELLGEFFGL
jgi:hypothetical protein